MLKEPLLEPILRKIRFRKTIKDIKVRNITIADIGCGSNIAFYSFLKSNRFKVKKYVGIDPLINSHLKNKGDIYLIRKSFVRSLPLKSASVHYSVAHAVLEHVNHPQKMLSEMIRITKPGGKVIITTPTTLAKSILEFLSQKLHLVSSREIKEHKNYFNKKTLISILENKKNIKISHNYFELGMNNYLIIKKTTRMGDKSLP